MLALRRLPLLWLLMAGSLVEALEDGAVGVALVDSEFSVHSETSEEEEAVAVAVLSIVEALTYSEFSEQSGIPDGEDEAAIVAVEASEYS